MFSFAGASGLVTLALIEAAICFFLPSGFVGACALFTGFWVWWQTSDILVSVFAFIISGGVFAFVSFLGHTLRAALLNKKAGRAANRNDDNGDGSVNLEIGVSRKPDPLLTEDNQHPILTSYRADADGNPIFPDFSEYEFEKLKFEASFHSYPSVYKDPFSTNCIQYSIPQESDYEYLSEAIVLEYTDDELAKQAGKEIDYLVENLHSYLETYTESYHFNKEAWKNSPWLCRDSNGYPIIFVVFPHTQNDIDLYFYFSVGIRDNRSYLVYGSRADRDSAEQAVASFVLMP